ncbi:hypothetical protein A3K86_03585 [Photobacterium jeanii]|uniref:DUF192 domain-containing protein n=1 Tax=Photobacterium jeanii TaxID=858640 RepID=A0A178KMM8_9GAMM|nr:hypothetical protein [Photobacterium jeanii]OAN18014.1 hypothetical protein A3K86_03585 [Photobacterium jeanii]PST92317.1 hypothetical protein C9I91_03855 [Photobacterium jeanii]
MRNIKLIYTVLLLVLSGCSSIPVDHSAPKLQLDDISVVNKSSGDVKVGIARNNNLLSSMLHYWPTVSGKAISGMLTGDVIEFYVPAGKLKLGAACYGGWSQSWKLTELNLDVTVKDERFFLLSPAVLDGSKYLDIEEVSEDVYKSKLKSGQRIEVGTVSKR